MKKFNIVAIILYLFCFCNEKKEPHDNVTSKEIVTSDDSRKKMISDINPEPIEEFKENCYHNSIYKFSICFPVKWIFKKMTDPIVIFNTQPDSAKGFIIMKMPDNISSIFSRSDIDKMSSDDIADIEKKNIDQLKELNYTVKYSKTEKSALSGISTLFSFSRVIGKLGDIENVEMVIVKHLIITPNEKVIGIEYSVPAIFFNGNEKERYTSVFNSFKFDK